MKLKDIKVGQRVRVRGRPLLVGEVLAVGVHAQVWPAGGYRWVRSARADFVEVRSTVSGVCGRFHCSQIIPAEED